MNQLATPAVQSPSVQPFADRLLATTPGAEIIKHGIGRARIKVVYDVTPSPLMQAALKYYGFQPLAKANTYSTLYNSSAIAWAILLTPEGNAAVDYQDEDTKATAEYFFRTNWMVHNFYCVLERLEAKLPAFAK